MANLGSVNIHLLEMGGALEALGEMIKSGTSNFVCFCESNLLTHAWRSPSVRGAIGRASMVLCDGVSLRLLAKVTGQPMTHRVRGPVFMKEACGHGVSLGWRHFLVGGAEGVAAEMADRLRAELPGIEIVGHYCPPFREMTPQEDAKLAQDIAEARADVVWVALGAPKQELWMSSRLGKIPAPVMLGVGAAFDFHTGRVPWAPRLVRRMGMEWAFRALTGGRRVMLRNLWCVSQTLSILATEAVRHQLGMAISHASPTLAEIRVGGMQLQEDRAA